MAGPRARAPSPSARERGCDLGGLEKRGVWMSVVMGRVEPDRTPDYDSGVVTLVRQTEVIPGDARDKLAGPTMTIRWTFTLTKRGNRWVVTTIDKQQWEAESRATP